MRIEVIEMDYYVRIIGLLDGNEVIAGGGAGMAAGSNGVWEVRREKC
jgi:hypothetical protein